MTPSVSPQYVCYRCRNKIPLDDLEKVFQEQLRDFFLSPDDVASYLAEGDRILKDKRELLTALERERNKVAEEKAIDFLYVDIRKRYSDSRRMTKSLNLHRQQYCGCIYSEWERYANITIE